MKLVIAEKPSVGANIASVLGANIKKQGYLVGNGYIVSWCVGHLIELAEPEAYGEEYKIKPWITDCLPIIPEKWKFGVIKETSSQYKNLKSLMNDPCVDEVICATDAGREGECIFRYVYKLCRCSKPVKRLWISSVEKNDIINGFNDLKDDSDYDRLYQSGYARSKADWLVGMNGTRLFSAMYNNFLSVGRVQTPTLKIIVDRENEINNFKSEKYYTVLLNCGEFTAESARIPDLPTAKKILQNVNTSTAFIKSIKKESKKVSPPKLFNIADLQKTANRLFGYTAKQTLDYAQSLYEKKLITYPRTDSNYVNSSMKDKIIQLTAAASGIMSAEISFTPDADRVINDKKVTDHHALLPTLSVSDADIEAIPDSEMKILRLICSQLIYAVSPEHIYESTAITVSCADTDFTALGKKISQMGWKEFQLKFVSLLTGKEMSVKETIFTDNIVEGLVIENHTEKIADHQTTPPKRYTDSSLISAMERAGNEDYEDENVEKKGIGTQATQAGIIETIIKRGYVERSGKNLCPTQKGISLIEAVPEEIKSPKTTAIWESKLQLIEKGEYSPDDFMNEINEFVKSLVDTYSKEDNINKDLSFRAERKVIGKCPKCGKNVVEYPKSYGCESGKDGCGFVIWKKISGKTIPESAARSLLDYGKSAKLKGFKKKDGSGTFSAYLMLDKEFKVAFKFK